MIDTSSWKEFYLKDLFGQCKRGTRITKTDRIEGNIPFVTAGENNEGVSEKIGNIEAITYNNALTIDMFGNCFYHNYPFKCDDNILIFTNEHINSFTGLFLATIILQDKYRYSYGNQYRQNNYNKHVIKLPSTPSGEPNWQYMEDFIDGLHSKPITTANKSHELPLKVEEWGEFRVGDLFEIVNGSGITKEEIEDHPGELKAIQSGEENNGCIGMIDQQYCIDKKYAVYEKPVLTVARSGSAGFVSYQKYGCVVGDSAKLLILKKKEYINDGVMLFLQTILTTLRFKYAYGRKVTQEKYRNEIIKLPITPNGDPDWKFMEDYIKSLPYGDRL